MQRTIVEDKIQKSSILKQEFLVFTSECAEIPRHILYWRKRKALRGNTEIKLLPLLLLLHASISRELFQYQTKNTVPWQHFNVPVICKASASLWRSFFFNTKFCLELSCIPHVFQRERIVTVPRKIGIFGLIIFPQNEKLFIRYMLSA